MPGVLAAALHYAEQGVPVFPCQKNKRPYVKGGFKAATTDEVVIREWWKRWPNAMIGAPTGERSGFMNVDYDTGADLKPPRDVVRFRTQSGGYHAMFQYDGRTTNSHNAQTHIDVRGEGGYVILPPSRGEHGQYRWIGSKRLPDIGPPPDSVRMLLNGSKNGSKEILVKGDATDVQLDTPLSRHEQMMHLAFKLSNDGWTNEKAIEFLILHARKIGLPKRERGFDEVKRLWEYANEQGRLDVRIHKEVQSLHVHRLAKEKYNASLMQHIKDPVMRSLAEELAINDPDEIFMVDELWVAGSNVQLAGLRKSGKSTLILNLIKSLCDGTPFLNCFPVKPPDGRVVYLNYENPPRTFRRAIRAVDVSAVDKLHVMHLEGRPLLFWESTAQKALVETLQELECEVLVIDPLVMAAQGMIDNENDSTQAARFQFVLEQVKVSAGIESLFVVSHTGWQANGRTRGSSQWEGWPDCLWSFESEKDDYRTPRSLSCWGRDGIDQPPMELSFKDGIYTWDGATRGTQGRILAEVADLKQIQSLTESNNGIAPIKSAVRKKVRTNDIKRLVENGYVKLVQQKPGVSGGRAGFGHVITQAGLDLIASVERQ